MVPANKVKGYWHAGSLELLEEQWYLFRSLPSLSFTQHQIACKGYIQYLCKAATDNLSATVSRFIFAASEQTLQALTSLPEERNYYHQK